MMGQKSNLLADNEGILHIPDEAILQIHQEFSF